MKKIAAITFHGAHNFGSNLQAYALQHFISSLCEKNSVKYKYEILNLRTKKQLELYSLFKPNNKLKNVLKNFLALPYINQLKKKNDNFEHFINNYLNITDKTFHSEDDLINSRIDYNYFISGSDQVWNIRALDFNWANYLSFVKGGKKISYAASFGPLTIDWKPEYKEKSKRLLENYDQISVREVGSYNNVKELTGRESLIHVDPTMLLSKEEWLDLMSQEPVDLKNQEKYILFYGLEPNKKTLELVNNISRKLKLPVVITKFNNKYDYFNRFKKNYSTGPIEFLQLVNNAELIISTSFHGTVFSIIFNKPFFAIDGLLDNRISTLLKIMNLEERSITNSDWVEKCTKVNDVDFVEANKVIESKRLESEQYLLTALDIK